MFEVVISSSSNSVDKAIYDYHDSTSYNDSSSRSSSSSSSSSSSGNTTNEEYTFGVPRISLEVFQEQLRMRVASGSQASTSTNVPPSTLVNKVEIVYSCAVGIPSKMSEQRLNSLRVWYQISDYLNPRLAVRGDWCYNPHFRIAFMSLTS